MQSSINFYIDFTFVTTLIKVTKITYEYLYVITGATAFTNYEVFVSSADRPTLQQDEYLARDLCGTSCYVRQNDEIEVKDGENERKLVKVGVVNAVVPPEELADSPFAAQFMHAMLEIRLLSSEELCLIPMVPQIVPLVNLEEDYIEIDPPVGLLDLSYAEKKKKVAIRGFLPATVDISSQLRKELEAASVVVWSIPGTMTIKDGKSKSGNKKQLLTKRNRDKEGFDNINKTSFAGSRYDEQEDANLLYYDQEVAAEEYLLEKEEKERDRQRKFYS